MSNVNRWKILGQSQAADEELCRTHLESFVESFVEKSRRERWRTLLLERPKRIFRHSSKLEAHLDRRRCMRVESLPSFTAQDIGLYYDFQNSPVILDAADIIDVGCGCDGIFSLKPGKLAYYFSHEDVVWHCSG